MIILKLNKTRELMDLTEITVVILSRDRQDYLIKTLRYWSSVRIRILVLDNSIAPLELAKIPKNVKYLHSKTSYGNRCIQAAKLIDTEYAIMSSDDEVYLPSGLGSAIKALKNNFELISVGGQVLALGQYGSQLTYSLPYSFNYGYENLHDKPIDRLKEHFDINAGYRNGSLYRLMRTKILATILLSLENSNNIRTPYLMEVTSEILIAGLGKTQYLDDLFWIRNWINPPVKHKTWDRREYFHKWADAEPIQYESWASGLSYILKLNAIEKSEIFAAIREIRKNAELNEASKKRIITSFLPTSFRYLLKKTFMPKCLPSNIEETINQMNHKSIDFSPRELRKAVDLFASYQLD